MRVWVADPRRTVLLIWTPVLRLPRPLAQPVLLIGQAVLFIFFLHYPFLLAVRTLLGGIFSAGTPRACNSPLVWPVRSCFGPVVTAGAGSGTLAHARMRRGKNRGRAGRARKRWCQCSAKLRCGTGRSDAAPCLATDRRWALLDGWHLRLSPQDVLQDPVDRRFHPAPTFGPARTGLAPRGALRTSARPVPDRRATLATAHVMAFETSSRPDHEEPFTPFSHDLSSMPSQMGVTTDRVCRRATYWTTTGGRPSRMDGKNAKDRPPPRSTASTSARKPMNPHARVKAETSRLCPQRGLFGSRAQQAEVQARPIPRHLREDLEEGPHAACGGLQCRHEGRSSGPYSASGAGTAPRNRPRVHAGIDHNGCYLRVPEAEGQIGVMHALRHRDEPRPSRVRRGVRARGREQSAWATGRSGKEQGVHAVQVNRNPGERCRQQGPSTPAFDWWVCTTSGSIRRNEERPATRSAARIGGQPDLRRRSRGSASRRTPVGTVARGREDRRHSPW